MAKVTETDANNSRRGEYNNGRYSQRNRTDKAPAPTGQRQRRAAQRRRSARVTQGNSVSRYKPLQGRGALRTTQSGWSTSLGQGTRPTYGRGGTSGFGPALLVEGLLRLGGAINKSMSDSREAAATRRENQGAAYRNQLKPLPKVEMPEYVKPKPKPKAKPVKKRQELSPAARNFDRAFAAARAQGLSEFTWRGGRYGTQLAY